MKTELLGTQLPIIQAPMAGVQGPELAAAVSNAGGLGSLPCAMIDSEALEVALTKLQVLTNKPYNVNFFCHQHVDPAVGQLSAWSETLAPYFKELQVAPPAASSSSSRAPFNETSLAVLERFCPAVVSFHFGLPEAAAVKAIQSWGGRVIATATTLAEARWLQEHGADGIIAQGLEAGGHRGSFLTDDMTTQVSTFALVPQICAAVELPVIAAGGIATAAGVSAALRLGAAAVQVGTAFLLCDEAATSPLHRTALKSDAARHTALTNVFTGRPARSIVNRLIREVGPFAQAAPVFPAAAMAVSALRSAAEPLGSTDFTPLWSGQNASACREVPAAVLLSQLAEGL
ncbi:MAG: nitronate monooxygenase [Halieaceae bacterium]|jgi:nitronate monooxygenase